MVLQVGVLRYVRCFALWRRAVGDGVCRLGVAKGLDEHQTRMGVMQRLVVISGHSSGLGQALAAYYLAAGMRVMGLSRRLAPSHVHLTQAALDLSDSRALAAWLAGAEWYQAVRAADEVYLLNNAATVLPNALANQQAAEDVIAAVALNVTAPMLLSHALLRDARSGVGKRIVHISSGAGRRACVGWSVYGATKAALDHHAAVVAAENHPHLRIASIAPGVVDTDMQACIRSADAQLFPERARFEALHRSGGLQSAADTAQRIAAMVAADDFGQVVCADVRQP